MAEYLVTGPDGKKYRVKGQGSKEEALAAVRRQVEPDQGFAGNIIPFSREPGEEGIKVPLTGKDIGHFDPSAGVLGSLGRTVMGPLDAMSGKLPPGAPETYARAQEAGAWMAPASGIGLASRVAPKLPTAKELTTAGGKQIERAQNMGVDFDANAVAGWAQSFRGGLERKIHPTRAEQTFKLLESLENAPAGSVMEFRGLVAARQGFQDIAQSAKGQEKLAATLAIKEIDKFLGSVPEGSVLAGPAGAASRKYVRGRANYATGKRSDDINARSDYAELRAEVANSGRGSGNRLRVQAAWFLDPLHPKRLDGFAPAEIAMLRDVATGSATRNTLRYIGNKLGGGGGLGGMVAGGTVGGGIGAYSGRPGLGVLAGIAAPAVGAAARSADNILTRRAFNRADKAVRSRSPLYSERIKNAPMTPIPPQARALIASTPLKAGLAPPLPRPPMTEEEWRAYVAAGGA